MDDSLEQPTARQGTNDNGGRDGDNNDNGDGDNNDANEEVDDGVLDWTKLLCEPSASRPFIPKRGEKEFEPRAEGVAIPSQDVEGGTALQQHLLNRAREAMFDALRVTRAISSKNISYGIWYPNLSRTHVTVARGMHFSSIGHSAPRPVVVCDHPSQSIVNSAHGRDVEVAVVSTDKIAKRLELLPEEAIYLVERGTMLCWKALPSASPKIESTMLGGLVPGAPMSVQQVYAEMIGREGLTLEKLQVYTYLKRLGYIITRAEPLDPYYPVFSPSLATSWRQKSSSILQRLWSLFSGFIGHLVQFVTRSNVRDWWHPLKLNRWLSHNKNYHFIFQSLRFVPSGHKVPLHRSQVHNDLLNDTPYKIFYNVYKPNTPFKKSAPGKPDFQVVVVDARATPVPTLHELANLFDQVPEVPPPRPRRKATNSASASEKKEKDPLPPPAAPSGPQFRWLPFFFQEWFSRSHVTINNTSRPNPFASLKMGQKIIVIAAVDGGNISFFRFGQGYFEQWPML